MPPEDAHSEGSYLPRWKFSHTESAMLEKPHQGNLADTSPPHLQQVTRFMNETCRDPPDQPFSQMSASVYDGRNKKIIQRWPAQIPDAQNSRASQNYCFLTH
jgi:hypothetical protein